MIKIVVIAIAVLSVAVAIILVPVLQSANAAIEYNIQNSKQISHHCQVVR